jgi:phosphomannomutase
MSNFGLYKAFDKIGIGYEKTAVGDKYVYENMKENDHILGGEQSGHIIFRKYARTGDGVLTAIMLMMVLKLPIKRCYTSYNVVCTLHMRKTKLYGIALIVQ